MLDLAYVTQQRLETIKKLSDLERQALLLRGALAAYDDQIEQARKGGGSVAAPATAPAPPPQTPTNNATMEGMKALRIGTGALQADQELRE